MENKDTSLNGLFDLARQHGIPTEKIKIHIANANRANPYVDITPFVLGISDFPFINYTGFHPDNDEVLIYVTLAATFKDKEQIVGYTGESAGVSVRVAKGVTVRTGGRGGRAVRDTVRQVNMGDLLVTNKRVMFVGKDDSFEFKIEKISTVKQLDRNSFVILSGRSSKNVWVDEDLFPYTYASINDVIDQKAQGVDLNASVKAAQSKITPEQIALCNQFRNECSLITAPKPKPKENQGCLLTIANLLLFMVALVAIIAAI